MRTRRPAGRPVHGSACSATCASTAAATASSTRRERGAEAVARDREHVSVARVDRRAEEVVVTAECGLHRRRVLGPHSGRTLDVGEEERHQPGRPNPHTRSLT